MKRIKKIGIGLILAFILTVSTPGAFFSGVSNMIVAAAASAPKTTTDNVTLYVGHETYQIGFEKLSRSAVVTFQSSNPGIAKVSKSGIITPKAVGSAIITATIKQNKKTYKSKINVKVFLPSLKFTDKVSTLSIGDTYTFKAVAYGIKGSISWSVSDSSTAGIDEKSGKLTAFKNGEVEVIVTAGSLSGIYTVTVKAPKLTTATEPTASPSPSPTSVPVPTPTDAPVFIPSTPTPVPVAMSTPVPAATPSPVPTATPTPVPTATPTPVPTATPTPVPTAMPTPEPTATPTPEPTVTPTPIPFFKKCYCGYIALNQSQWDWHEFDHYAHPELFQTADESTVISYECHCGYKTNSKEDIDAHFWICPENQWLWSK